jgi:glycosyltransferase involved in cell wall biosynthesis
MNNSILLSVLIPVYNETDTIKVCYKELIHSLSKYENSLELIFIDDGSTDNSIDILHQISKDDSRVKCIFLSRNFGKEAAMTAGIHFAQGEFITIIDCDLQDPPELIPEMIAFAKKNNFDVVYGVRSQREGETFIKKNNFLFIL